MDDELSKAVYILSQSRRNHAQLEWLSLYLLFMKDYRKHVAPLNTVLKLQLCRCMKLQIVSPGDKVYKKDSSSDYLYMILQGSVELYAYSEGTKKLLSVVNTGF